MFARWTTAAATAAVVLGFAGFAAAADGSTRVSYVGGHDPGRLVRIERAPEVVAPYALTGYQSSNYASQKTTRTELIWVGQRIVGVRVVSE